MDPTVFLTDILKNAKGVPHNRVVLYRYIQLLPKQNDVIGMDADKQKLLLNAGAMVLRIPKTVKKASLKNRDRIFPSIIWYTYRPQEML